MKSAKEDQILEMIKQSASVLVCLPEKPTTDAIASGLAVLSVIEKLGKKGRVVSSGFQLPATHAFLPKSNEIFDDLTALRKFIISLDISNKSVEDLSYTIEDDKLNVYVSPKDGFFTQNDVSTTSGDYAFDLIIVIDAQDLDALGRIYEMNADFFYHTPLINIDQSPANDHFGQVNLINVTATSCSEILFELVKDWGDNILDEYIATNLLTGMISKTKSFQSGSVTPRSLSIASHLISQGARREDIVKHLYQSKKISTLKLWGRVLTTLEVDTEHKIVWSRLTRKDFESVGATEDDLSDVIDELIINSREARNVFIVYNVNPNEVKAIVSTAPYTNAIDLFSEFNPEGTEHFIHFTYNHDHTVEQVADIILQKLRSTSAK
ncbi:MAG: hypothetical protein ABIG66_01185 [Candidatus Kerfeldbacteria bacterium]